MNSIEISVLFNLPSLYVAITRSLKSKLYAFINKTLKSNYHTGKYTGLAIRKSSGYKKYRCHYEKTKSPKGIHIGERRKPQANGKPGYIRIDTVHQGDLDGRKGVYHINAVDEVTQFEVVVSVEKISEHYLIPALEILLASFAASHGEPKARASSPW